MTGTPTWRGGVILIVGPDGAGKSTLADALEAGPLSSGTVLRAHQRVRLLPRQTHHEGPVLEPHAKRPYPAWVSVLKLLYLYVDSLLGWWTHIRPVVRRGGFVLLERGWWDLAVDPRRYRMIGTVSLAGALGRIMPSPDLVMVLEAPAALIHARVPELPEAELDRQTAAWRSLRLPRAQRVVLDASQPPPDVLRAAAESISTYLDRPGCP